MNYFYVDIGVIKTMLGNPKELVTARYERNGWSAQKRPDTKAVGAWSLELLASFSRPRAQPNSVLLGYKRCL